MITYPVDNWCACAPRIVQIRETVGKPRPKVQQCSGGPPGHACPTIGSTSADTLEKTKHDTQAGHAVERRYYRHLGSTRICEAYLYASTHGGLNQSKCTCSHKILSRDLGAKALS
jgi:hypothetical protein